ncbi:MAG: hypothetical protein COA44_14400 [Arcobacter sp.]|nr:MAG: hypothetical protein COA44_14400 [Arcobacter sp.]
MIKKIIAGTLLSAMTLFALPNTQIELLLVGKAVQKKAVVLSNMGITGETKEKFGKLYDEYQVKLMKHRISELKLIRDYAMSYNNMTDENANKIIVEWATVEDSELVLKKNYVAKFKKVMPSADVIRYFQIENRLQLLREVQTTGLIPLAQPAPVQPEVK